VKWRRREDDWGERANVTPKIYKLIEAEYLQLNHKTWSLSEAEGQTKSRKSYFQLKANS